MNDMFFSEVLLFLFLSLLDLLIPEAYSGFQQTSKMGNFATIRRSILDVYRSLDTLLRSSQRRCSVKKGVFRNFAKFTGKNLCQSLFFNKVAGLMMTLSKERRTTKLVIEFFVFKVGF